MKSMLKAVYAKPLIVYLVMALLTISTLAGPAEAMYVPTAPLQHGDAASMAVDRAADLATIQSALETRMVSRKLMDYGLSPEEAMARVSKLSDEQIHQLATHSDSLQAGGDGGGFLVGLLPVLFAGNALSPGVAPALRRGRAGNRRRDHLL